MKSLFAKTDNSGGRGEGFLQNHVFCYVIMFLLSFIVLVSSFASYF